MRTTLLKVIRRAKVNPWSRLWHSLRSSCESDLARSFPLAVVAKWLGNTPSVALRHYVDPTDASFTDAGNWTPPGAATAVQNAVQSGAVSDGQQTTDPGGNPGNPRLGPLGSVTVRSGSDDRMEAAGIERGASSSTETATTGPHGAHSGALPSADPLAAFLATLTPEQKARLAELLLTPPVPG